MYMLASTSLTDIGALAAFGLLIVLGIVKLAQSFGYLKSESKKEQEKLLKELHALFYDPLTRKAWTDSLDHIENMHGILTDRVHQGKQENVFESVQKIAQSTEELVKRLPPGKEFEIPPFFCACLRNKETPCFNNLITKLDSIQKGLLLLDDMLGACASMKEGMREWRESVLVQNERVIQVLTRMLHYFGTEGEES